jgi:ferrous iron transport protein A
MDEIILWAECVLSILFIHIKVLRLPLIPLGDSERQFYALRPACYAIHPPRLDTSVNPPHTGISLRKNTKQRLTLKDLRRGEEAVLEHLDLPADDAQRLMELGFLPGARLSVANSAPGGDPMVFRVDGSEVALRRETASHLKIRWEGPAGASTVARDAG